MLKNNLLVIKNNIAQSAQKSGRDPDQIKLIVVTKTQPAEKIDEAIALGIENFGENYPEETKNKINNIKEIGKNIRWHMIGHLQSRKIPIICDYFHYLQTIDSIDVSQKLDQKLASREKKLDCLLEVNVSGESSKFGFAAWNELLIEQLCINIRQILELTSLRINGLMTMPPLYENPEDARAHFRKLKEIQSLLKTKFPDHQWGELSMGTSLDYKVAVEEGATMIRIGQALFGPRK